MPRQRTARGRARRLPGPVTEAPHPAGAELDRLPTIRLVARYADVWHCWGSPGSLQEASARIDELAEQAGRDPSAIQRARVRMPPSSRYWTKQCTSRLRRARSSMTSATRWPGP